MSFLNFLPMIADVAGSIFGSNSAHEANRTNIKLARENRDWQTQMENTAVQRRVADIKAAGGNPALAFTNGGSAGTPAVASPTVEPTFRPDWTKGGGAQALMLKAQLANLNAQTANTAAQARLNSVEANIREKAENSELEKRVKTNVERFDQEGWKTRILEQQFHATAAERQRAEGTVEAAIQKAKQEAELGRLDTESAQRIAKEFGLSTGPTSTFMRMIIDLMRLMKKD